MIGRDIERIFEQIREPLGVDRWSIAIVNDKNDEGRATCEAASEYREATITLDFDKLKTGDDLQELVVHETTHCLTMPVHELAHEMAQTLAKVIAPENPEPMIALLTKQVDRAAERVTTDVGHAFLRLLRRAGHLDTPAVDA